MAAEKKPGRAASGGGGLQGRVTEAISEAALAELAETGYARMSMEAVARRAGAGKAALYRRWPSKQAMLTELVRDKVTAELPAQPATGTLSGDVRELLTSLRDQLVNPFVATVGLGLLAESRHDEALAEVLRVGVAAPRREVARTVMQNAIGRGELPRHFDVQVGIDLLIAPLAFRILVTQDSHDDDYLDRLSNAIEAALKACC